VSLAYRLSKFAYGARAVCDDSTPEFTQMQGSGSSRSGPTTSPGRRICQSTELALWIPFPKAVALPALKKHCAPGPRALSVTGWLVSQL